MARTGTTAASTTNRKPKATQGKAKAQGAAKRGRASRSPTGNPGAADPSDFNGFPRGGEAFFEELAARQDRDWFKANKARYETLWQTPLQAFLDALAVRLEPVFPGASQTRRKVFRIYRDVRFSADKSPFKTNIAAVLPLTPSARPEQQTLVAYMHFGADERFVGLGYYELPKPALERFRRAVASDAGAQLARRIAAVEAKGLQVGSREQLKRVPPGFPADHPRADLLKRKGLFVHFPKLPKAILRKPELVDWFIDNAKTARPVVAWVQESTTDR